MHSYLNLTLRKWFKSVRLCLVFFFVSKNIMLMNYYSSHENITRIKCFAETSGLIFIQRYLYEITN